MKYHPLALLMALVLAACSQEAAQNNGGRIPPANLPHLPLQAHLQSRPNTVNFSAPT